MFKSNDYYINLQRFIHNDDNIKNNKRDKWLNQDEEEEVKESSSIIDRLKKVKNQGENKMMQMMEYLVQKNESKLNGNQ
jgi:Xaa-Pro aminopeptidase